MAAKKSDDFYVGYQKVAPRGLSRLMGRAVAILILGGVALALAFAITQKPFGPGVFEYLRHREFEGVVQQEPVPALLVARPGRSAINGSSFSRYALVAPGKHGAGPLIESLDGHRARLEGTLIYHDGQTMLEIVPESIELVGGTASQPVLDVRPVDLGRHTLRGEIVDSKCYLGVMKPGREKPHRACAALCIRGGVPPILVSEAASGEQQSFLLVDAHGRTLNERILGLVAEPVEITGDVRRYGDLLVLAADPAAYRRLSE
jgi:hypothetical protein